MLVTNEIFINSVLSTANKSAKQILQQDSSLQTPTLRRPAVGSQKNKRGKAGAQFSHLHYVLLRDIREGAPREKKKKRSDSTSKAVGLWKQSCTRLYKEVSKQEGFLRDCVEQY